MQYPHHVRHPLVRPRTCRNRQSVTAVLHEEGKQKVAEEPGGKSRTDPSPDKPRKPVDYRSKKEKPGKVCTSAATDAPDDQKSQ